MPADGTAGRVAKKDARTLRRTRRIYRRTIEHSAWLYPRYLRWRGNHAGEIRPGTALVVCGYPGSANSFLREAILHANPHLPIASHLHSWTLVANATRQHVPVVFVARQPLDAVVSQLVRFPDRVTPAWALRDYAWLYRKSSAYADRMVIATFEEATSDVGGIIRRVNARFGLSLVPFDDESDNDTVLGRMADHSQRQFGEQAAVRGSVPSDERQQRKDRIRAEVTSARYADLLAAASEAYGRLLATRT